MHQNNTAIEYFRKSIGLAEKMTNTLGLAMNYNNIGEAFFNMKMTDSALYYFERSLDYNERINSQVGQLHLHGQCLSGKKGIQQSIGLSQQSIGVAHADWRFDFTLGHAQQSGKDISEK